VSQARRGSPTCWFSTRAVRSAFGGCLRFVILSHNTVTLPPLTVTLSHNNIILSHNTVTLPPHTVTLSGVEG
jgi:hypothetical protein